MAATRHERPRLVLDTGPLLTYIVLYYLRASSASRARRDAILQNVRGSIERPFTELAQERLEGLPDRAEVLLTTPHVLVELLKLRSLSGLLGDEYRFRSVGLEALKSARISERHYPLDEMCSEPDFEDLICRYGVTDAGLVYVANKEECVVLTDDRRLFAAYSAGSRFEIRGLEEYLLT